MCQNTKDKFKYPQIFKNIALAVIIVVIRPNTLSNALPNYNSFIIKRIIVASLIKVRYNRGQLCFTIAHSITKILQEADARKTGLYLNGIDLLSWFEKDWLKLSAFPPAGNIPWARQGWQFLSMPCAYWCIHID